MADNPMDRRDFHKLTLAAMGGLVAGTSIACSKKEDEKKDDKEGKKEETAGKEKEKHVCRGLNSCKGNGRSGRNECRGQGACATVAHHDCGGKNTCKGLGGCGEAPAANDCKGDGGCHVPLMESAWPVVRARLEAKWKEEGKEFGDAPEKDPPPPTAETPSAPKGS